MSGHDELDPESIARLEGLLLAAREYVTTSDDLRPRTLELARQGRGLHIGARRMALCAACCLLMWSVCLPASRALRGWRHQFVAPFPNEIYQTGAELATQQNFDPQWGLVEAFMQLRTLHVGTSGASSSSLNTGRRALTTGSQGKTGR